MFHTTSETLGSGTRIEYGYNSSGWRDQLTSYNGETIAYDETVDPSAKLGNPTTYRGQPMQWAKGKNLASYSGHTFDYNVAGIRTTKTVGDIETTYYLDGTKIIAEEKRYKSNNNLIDALYYHYGFDGVTGFERKTSLDQLGTIYVYGKNVQGDITHIYTKAGVTVAEYIYDAWGNHSVSAAAGYEELAERNPFRYRAYYYDTAIKLYYLQSRYYDSVIGRFINLDDISELNAETINGLNLFAYCANNPVLLSDSTGCRPTITNSQGVDLISFIMEMGIGGGLALVGWATKIGARPNNIGVGIFRKMQAKQIAGLTKASGVLSKVSTGLAIISTGISVFEGIQRDIGRGYATDRIVSNAITNTVVYGGLTFGIGLASGAIGAKIGMLLGSAVPLLGNVIGAAIGFAVGIGIGFLLDWQIGGKSVIDHIGDGVYDFWKWLFG